MKPKEKAVSCNGVNDYQFNDRHNIRQETQTGDQLDYYCECGGNQ